VAVCSPEVAAKSFKGSVRAFKVRPVAGRMAVLCSGGLDSSVLLARMARAGQIVYPLYVKAGLVWEHSELIMLRRFVAALGSSRIQPVTILRLPYDDVARKHWSVTGRRVPGFHAATESNYIVGRNLSLLSKAAIFCVYERIGKIAMAPLDANPFPDARPEFFEAMMRAVELGLGLKLRIHAPFLGLSKAEIIRRSRDLPLKFTLSCARPRGAIHCGACTKCAERINGFREAGVPDPTRYANRLRMPEPEHGTTAATRS
jgi:7-cyano-7-deazaguanine synthase